MCSGFFVQLYFIFIWLHILYYLYIIYIIFYMVIYFCSKMPSKFLETQAWDNGSKAAFCLRGGNDFLGHVRLRSLEAILRWSFVCRSTLLSEVREAGLRLSGKFGMWCSYNRGFRLSCGICGSWGSQAERWTELRDLCIHMSSIDMGCLGEEDKLLVESILFY
jgi:hypothetical protein